MAAVVDDAAVDKHFQNSAEDDIEETVGGALPEAAAAVDVDDYLLPPKTNPY